MVKTTALLALSLMIALPAFADICKTGDLKGCAAALKKINAGDQGEKFAKAYDEVCGANAKFKCAKKIVRGDVKEETQYTVQDHPKATLFNVKLDGESYLYILESK